MGLNSYNILAFSGPESKNFVAMVSSSSIRSYEFVSLKKIYLPNEVLLGRTWANVCLQSFFP